MAMSKDRVEFLLRRSDNNKKINIDDLIELITETLGLTHAEARAAAVSETGIIIRCRPSQFARFIIRRMEVGEKYGSFTNGIRELRPKLIKPDPEVTLLDVSKRPADHGE